MRLYRSILTALASTALATTALAQSETPVGNAFTYQGQLQKNSAPHGGTADFTFKLFDAQTGGVQHGTTNTVNGLAVTNGLFTTTLDFGNPYTGRAVWLEIQVKTPGEAGYTTLSPRQRIHAVPYAVTALNGGASGPWLTQPGGINYNGHVAVQGTPNADIVMTVTVPPGTDDNGLYVSSSSASHAAFFVRNFATNGWGIFDDTSGRHHLTGNLGVGTLPALPLDVLNPLGNAVRIIGTGSILDAESVALSVLANTGGGVFGRSQIGVLSRSADNRAIAGFSTNSFGVTGDCTAAQTWGALGTANEGVFGFSGNVARPAAHFMAPAGGTAINAEGLVKVKTLQILGGADVAEPFDIRGGDDVEGGPEPGSLVVIDEANPGDLLVSSEAYDTRVAGVVSGANGLAPGMVLRAEGGELADGEHAVALTGRVWCKADAGYGAIVPGDLLTTSPTSGHAMKASDASRRGGAVIGKAMTALSDGRGHVLVLVNLQ